MRRTPGTFRPVRPLDAGFDSSAAVPFDPRTPTFVPAESIDNEHVRRLTSRKLQLYGAKVYNSGTQAVASNGAFNNLTFDTEAWDQGSFWSSTSATRLSIPFSGVYLISGFMTYEANATGVRQARILLNGTTGIGRYKTSNLGGAIPAEVAINLIQRLTAGDYIQLQAQQDSTVSLNIQDGEDDCFFAVDFRGFI